jgi:hypothetical protein
MESCFQNLVGLDSLDARNVEERIYNFRRDQEQLRQGYSKSASEGWCENSRLEENCSTDSSFPQLEAALFSPGLACIHLGSLLY